MKLPSKKLLSEVLGYSVVDVDKGTNNNTFRIYKDKHLFKYISTYELMHVMKVWATKNGFFEIFSATTINGKGVCCTVPEDYDLEGVSYHEGSYTYENTEFEAVTQACEWILKQGGSDDTKRS